MQSRAAQELSEDRYRLGVASFLEVLEAQRRALQSQDALLQTRRQALDNRVDLYLALESAHHGVVLEQVGELRVVEQVVDRHHLDVVALAQNAKDAAADAAETVDSHPRRHQAPSSASIAARSRMRSTTRCA